MFNLGFWELVLILAFALLLFGPKRLPEVGRALGRGIREFQSAIRGQPSDDAVQAEPLAPLRAPAERRPEDGGGAR